MALSRTSDPQTSHDAAELVESSGSAASHRAMCMDEVERQPGQTAAEIAKRLGLERHVPSRRLPELRPLQVYNGESRKCAETGNSSMTWFPTGKSQGELF